MRPCATVVDDAGNTAMSARDHRQTSCECLCKNQREVLIAFGWEHEQPSTGHEFGDGCSLDSTVPSHVWRQGPHEMSEWAIAGDLQRNVSVQLFPRLEQGGYALLG